jgi:hypothetical protein
VISGFHHEVDEKCGFLGYCAASSVKKLPLLAAYLTNTHGIISQNSTVLRKI